MDRKFSLLKTNRKTDKQTDERIPSYFARLKTILFLGFTFLLFLAPMLTDTAWAQNTWYSGIISVSGEETINGNVDVNGDVSLDIKQGKSLTVNGTIKIGSGSTLTMSNSGSLYVNQSSGSGFQLENGSTLEIKDGSLSINAEAYGIYSDLNVKSSVTVSGGSLTTQGGFMGIALVNSGSSVTVEGGSLTAVGSMSAIYSNVTNDIPGTGWTNTAGTGTATAIAAGSYSAGALSSYKKVVFKTKIAPIANAPTGITATYGQTLNDVTLTNPAGNTPGTWAWEDGNTSVGDAGSRTFKANFTPADIVTYNTVTGVNVSVNVGKAGAQTIADVTGFQLYTLTSVSESVAGKMPADAGTLTYKTGDAGTTGSVAVSGFAVDTNGNVSASLSGGAAGDTVTLPVIITSTNYADSTVNVVITLTAKDDAGVSINGGQDMTVTFGDAGFVPDKAVTAPGTDGTGTWQWKSSEPGIAEIDPDTGNITIRSAGSMTITAAYESDTTLGTASIMLTVAKKNISGEGAVTVTGDYVYNASPQEPAGENVSVKLGDTFLAAGTDYTVTAYANNTGAADKSAANAPMVTVTGQGNYIGTASGTFTIAKAVPVIDPLPAASAVTYGQRLQDSTLTGGAAVLGGTGVPGTFSWKAPDTVPSTSDSGTTEYIVAFTPDDSMNFETAECKVTLTVGSADPGVTPPSAVQGLVYSGSAQVLVKAGSAENGTMLYSLDGGAYSGTLPEQTDAGSWTVRWYVKGNEDHADSGSETEPLGSLSVTIARKAVTVKAEDQSKLAGAAEPELTAVVSGLIGSDTVTYTLTRAEGETAGTYDITPSGLAEQGNYTVTYEKGTLTIRNDSAEDVRQRTVPESLNTVPEGLGFSTVSELEQFLVENLVQLVVDGKPVQTEQTVCLDVKLEISFDGGTSWYPATEKNFPTGGLWVTLPYPEGTGKDTHEFTISHMFTMDSERLGTVKGEVETFGPSEIEKTDQGLRVKLKGLSPVAIGWSAIKPKETVELPVKVEHYRQDGTPGIPDDIPVDTELTLTLKLTGTGGDTIEKKAVMTVQPGERFTNASFFLDEEPAYPEYSFSVAVKPSSVRADIYSSEAAPVKEYSLSAKSVAPENDEESGFHLKVLLQWDDGSGAWKPEEVPVYALPEDEIGAYVLHNDGTKEYLLFQTYDICIYYLGSDELCAGYERCFHK